MNREIKFRAWDSYCNEMKYLSNKHIYYWGDDQLMQYTGLKDKNGVEIYEGDILQFSVGYPGIEQERFRVCFNQFAFGCRNMREHVIGFRPFLGMESSLIEHGFYQDLHEILEVIGNIYEHPELLKAAASSQTTND